MFRHKDELLSGRILTFMILHGQAFFYPSVSTFIIASKMDFEKRQAVADIIPLVFNQMIAFVQSAEVDRFADRFYANPDSQYLTVVASPQDQAVVVYEGIDFFDSYQREHKGDEK